jgi:hypothetical protein
MGCVVSATVWPIYPPGKSRTHCIGGWVLPRAALDGGAENLASHRDSIHGLSGPK